MPMNYNRKFPPYGKKLADLRSIGLVPRLRVVVVTDWRIGKIYPRIIVAPGTPPDSLRFDYLAGLHVQIAHFDRDRPVLDSLTQEILAVHPALLTAFNIDAVKRGAPASKLIFSKLAAEAAQHD